MILFKHKKNNFYLALVVSLFLHLLLFSSYGALKKLLILQPMTKEITGVENEEEKRLEFELVETPDDAATDQTPDNTNLLSDKNSIARDEYMQQDKAAGDPYSEGQTQYRTFAGAISPPPQPNIIIPNNKNVAERENKESEEVKAEEQPSIIRSQQDMSNQRFQRTMLMSGDQSNVQSTKQQALDDATYRNLNSSAEALGGITLNTYAWDFAPYILEMKNKLRQNIYPPPAFTRLGLIDGETVLRFKVMPNGEMRDLEALDHKGHPSLKETSLNAVKNSSPFRPLPADFPNEYLELTWTFIYSIIR